LKKGFSESGKLFNNLGNAAVERGIKAAKGGGIQEFAEKSKSG